MKKLVMRSQKWLSICRKRSCTVYNWLRSLLRPPIFIVTHYIRIRSTLRELCQTQKPPGGIAKRKEFLKIEETNSISRMGGLPRPFASCGRLGDELFYTLCKICIEPMVIYTLAPLYRRSGYYMSVSEEKLITNQANSLESTGPKTCHFGIFSTGGEA